MLWYRQQCLSGLITYALGTKPLYLLLLNELEALASEQEEEEENEEALLPAFLEQLAVEPSSST